MKHLFICVFALFSASIAVNAQEEVYDANGRQDPSTIWINKVDDGEEWRDENRWHDPFDIYSGPVLGVIASNLTDYELSFCICLDKCLIYLFDWINVLIINFLQLRLRLGREGQQKKE